MGWCGYGNYVPQYFVAGHIIPVVKSAKKASGRKYLKATAENPRVQKLSN